MQPDLRRHEEQEAEEAQEFSVSVSKATAYVETKEKEAVKAKAAISKMRMVAIDRVAKVCDKKIYEQLIRHITCI